MSFSATTPYFLQGVDW